MSSSDPQCTTGPLEDDPIVQTIPVFMASHLQSSLHLFQFPIQNRTMSHDFVPSSARIKPNGQAIELDIKLDPQAPTYDQGKGAQFAPNASARTIYDDPSHAMATTTTLLKSITLASTVVPALTTYYAATTRHDGIHLNPITNTYQFAPKLTHIDEISHSERLAKKRVEDEAKKQMGAAEPTQQKKPSPASMLPQAETKDMSLARQRSVALMKKELDKQPFSAFKYFPDHSPQANQIFQACFATYQDPIRYLGNSDEYLATLITTTMPTSTSVASKAVATGYSTRAQLKTQSVEHQISSLLHNAHVLHESILVPILTSLTDVSMAEIYQALALVAIPIRPKLWIIRSEYVYKNRELAARNYLVSMFSKSATVVRSMFAKVAQLDVDITFQLLSEISVLDKNAHPPHWVLKYSDDVLVEDDMHPALAKWLATVLPGSLAVLGLAPAQPLATKPRTAARAGRSAAALPSAYDPADLVAQSIIDCVMAHGVMAHDRLHAALLKLHPKLTEDVMHPSIHTLCHDVHGGYVLRNKPGCKSTLFRNVVIQQFASSPNGTAKKNDLISAHQEQNGEGVSTRVYEEVMGELAHPRDKDKRKPYYWKSVHLPL